ncbi:MAG TPA: hypothetical protein PLP70_00280 [bacterium]|nr:hypothetical protein [bacterium]HRS72968.1 hypothetical protein [Patescibacteria group bacterium]HOE81004.1 hypothetical protein [bacterium]HOR69318.1 hypothetical protein [bacterium]HOS99075.1 hypothetical protein [bacterium]
MKFTKFIVLILSIMVLAWPVLSLADPKQLVPDDENYEYGTYTLKDFESMAIFIGRVILGFAGAATLVMFVIGGIQMIIAAGNSENFKKGQQTLTNALIGLVVIFCSYMIINFVLTTLGAQNWTRTKLNEVMKQ